MNVCLFLVLEMMELIQTGWLAGIYSAFKESTHILNRTDVGD